VNVHIKAANKTRKSQLAVNLLTNITSNFSVYCLSSFNFVSNGISVMELKTILGEIIEAHVSSDAWKWLCVKANEFESTPSSFTLAFAAAPRRTGKTIIEINSVIADIIHDTRTGFSIQDWTVDRLARVWLILYLPSDDKAVYLRTLENIFLTAEMNEQVALYSALPVLQYPDAWQHRCTEGIRSNIGVVLESIMCDNPYPSEQLDEKEWNQLVLKAIFTEKPINRIIGLDMRANMSLAKTLSDYAHERWAAHRDVNPLLWRSVAPFVDAEIFADIERIAASKNKGEQQAAALVIQHDTFPLLSTLVQRHPDLKQFMGGHITWDTIANEAGTL
jgi:hypothetical protein